MECSKIPLCQSRFMVEKLPLLLSRFSLSYYLENNCINYFITDKATAKQISYSLVYSLNTFSNQIHVTKYYPELNKQSDTKYLSAACFYILTHHFAKNYQLTQDFSIFLETRPEIFENFYAKLKDFDFCIKRCSLGNNVEVCSQYCPHAVDTSMIAREIIDDKGLFII